jgi:hypothetical protein
MLNTTSARARYLAATFAVTGGLGLAAFGCGDDDSTTSASSDTSSETTTEASADTVDVTADEFSFDVSAAPTTDTKSFSVTNDGKEFHVMIFAQLGEGYTVDEAVKLQGEKGSATTFAEAEIPPGKTVEAEVKGEIGPGEYVMLCPVGGPEGPHYELGQLEEFEIG